MMTPKELFDGFDRINDGAARGLDNHLSLIDSVKAFSAENAGEPSDIEKQWRDIREMALNGGEAAIRELFLRGLHAEQMLWQLANRTDIFPMLEKKAEALACNLREELTKLYLEI